MPNEKEIENILTTVSDAVIEKLVLRPTQGKPFKVNQSQLNEDGSMDVTLHLDIEWLRSLGLQIVPSEKETDHA